MEPTSRSKVWQWWVAGLLLLATMINYMDRQTLSNLAVRITQQFDLSNEQYGDMEFVFGIAFAVGSLFFGIIADRVPVRLLYPAILVAWSAVGFATGLARGYTSLLVCRCLLGFFEAGHWPCALIVTQAVMSRGNRVMGNSILQSGASLGAILTPIVIRLMIGDSTEPDAWRTPFFVIGGIGVAWAFVWLAVIRRGDLQRQDSAEPAASQNEASSRSSEPHDSDRHAPGRWIWTLLTDRRFWALTCMVIAINTSWQLIRAWLPKFLQEGRGYSEAEALYFNSTYFIFTDVGCIAAGVVAMWLVRRGLRVHTSRVLVYLGCSLLAGLTTLAAVLPQGWPLLATLLCVAAGTLGVFPCYYSFTQEVSVTHMGRLTGMLSFIGWLASSPTQKLFGYVVDQTGSYDFNLAILGWSPLLGLILFLVLWPRHTSDDADAALPNV
ncbi:MFS transporter [Candidatus Laterigemmans baculatus]|uniref:MFS transporter n=1 Tax=Candidatus Laterigemmans baculatus TaxID=2770505 RepID=UPI0013DD6630|nr:MFS transporter [Candidatus Laterigemmans baculatus]